MLTEKEMNEEAGKLTKAMITTIQNNKPKDGANSGEQASILMTSLCEVVSICIMNTCAFSVLAEEIKGKKTIDHKIYLKLLRKTLFSGIEGLINLADFEDVKSRALRSVIKCVKEENDRKKLEEELIVSPPTKKKEKGPWSL